MTEKLEPFFSVCLIVNLEHLDLSNAAVEPLFENFTTRQELSVYGRSRFGQNNVGPFKFVTRKFGIGIDAQINGVDFLVNEDAGGMQCYIRKLSITQHSFASVIWFEDEKSESYYFGQIDIYLNDNEIDTLIEYMKAGFKTVHFTLFTNLDEQKKHPFFNSETAPPAEVFYQEMKGAWRDNMPTDIDYEIEERPTKFPFFEKFQFNLNNKIDIRDYNIYFRIKLSRFLYEDKTENDGHPN